MGYNRRNMIEKAKAVQALYKEHVGRNGSTAEWTYKNVIYPRFYISRSTFYNYLVIDVEAALKQLDNE